jgi:hypothetical protein
MFFPYNFAFNLITFPVCPYTNIFTSTYINTLTLSIQNGHLPWTNRLYLRDGHCVLTVAPLYTLFTVIRCVCQFLNIFKVNLRFKPRMSWIWNKNANPYTITLFHNRLLCVLFEKWMKWTHYGKMNFFVFMLFLQNYWTNFIENLIFGESGCALKVSCRNYFWTTSVQCDQYFTWSSDQSLFQKYCTNSWCVT